MKLSTHHTPHRDLTRSRRRGPNAGFTLVELIVVIAVMAILQTLAAGGLRTLLGSQTVKNTSFELFAALLHARSEALTRNREVRVTPLGADWSQGWIVVTTDGLQLARSSAPAGVTISGPTAVTFRANGRPLVGPGEFVVSSAGTRPDDSRCLRVNASGRAQLARGSCT